MRDISYRNVDMCGNTVKIATYENWMQRQIRNGKHGAAVSRTAYDRQIEKDLQMFRDRLNCPHLTPEDVAAAPKVDKEKTMKPGEKELYSGEKSYDEYDKLSDPVRSVEQPIPDKVFKRVVPKIGLVDPARAAKTAGMGLVALVIGFIALGWLLLMGKR